MSFNLFQRTALTLTAGLALYAAFSVLVVKLLVVQPVTERAAQELAALVELSAKVWIELPPWTREDFEAEMRERHGLRIGQAESELAEVVNHQDFLTRLESALAARFDSHHHILYDSNNPDWYWIDVPIAQQRLRLGFEQARLRQQLPTAVVLVVGAGALFVLLTTLLVVRRVTQPLSRLYRAVQSLGHGESFRPVPESGATELAALARQINRTEFEVRELVANRTTLLAGISHDLRTPIARMRLELELLEDQADPALVEGLRSDLVEMNELIGRVMELAQGLERHEPGTSQVAEVLNTLALDYARNGVSIACQLPDACEIPVHPSILRRVVGNLLDNAVHYGAGKPIEILAACRSQQIEITVRDHGPGIPDDQRTAVLRPFYRLEGSRSRDTGGSGLGLAIVDQLCKAYGWSLGLVQAEGGGLAARIRIPVTTDSLGASSD